MRRLVAERGSKAAISLPGPKRPLSASEGLADGGGVVREVVDHGDPGGDAANLLAAAHAQEPLHRARDGRKSTPRPDATAMTPTRFSWL